MGGKEEEKKKKFFLLTLNYSLEVDRDLEKVTKAGECEKGQHIYHEMSCIVNNQMESNIYLMTFRYHGLALLSVNHIKEQSQRKRSPSLLCIIMQTAHLLEL